MNLVLFDGDVRKSLYPITFTRPIGAIRVGILTICQKWEKLLKSNVSFLTADYLQGKYPLRLCNENLFVFGGVLPEAGLLDAMLSLKFGDALVAGDYLLALKSDESGKEVLIDKDLQDFNIIEYKGPVDLITRPYHLIGFNKEQIARDFELITAGRKSCPVDETVTIVGAHQKPELIDRVFIEEGAEVGYVYINPQDGPVYIGKNVCVFEGSMIRGPVALCDSAQINMGAKIYGGTTVGPFSKVGGEVNNALILGYANKVHDGFLGDSVIGEWCNLGADTNTSNLKNDFAKVKLWDYGTGRFLRTGLQFCGLIMGDYSRCAINTQFNSGTVVGVGANIFGCGFPRNFIPSFVIGGPQGYKVNSLKTVISTGAMAMKRRNVVLEAADEEILSCIYEKTQQYRSSFK